MSNKPASRLIAKALPRGDRFVAQFALPGLVPDLVKRGGAVHYFDDQVAAETAAKDAVIRLYESRTIDTRKAGVYKRLTGAELATYLAQVGITPTYFAEVAGVPQSRVMKWLDGEQDIPHSVHVLIKLIAASDRNLILAAELTAQCMEDP